MDDFFQNKRFGGNNNSLILKATDVPGEHLENTENQKKKIFHGLHSLVQLVVA